MSAAQPEDSTPAVAVVSDGSGYPERPHARVLQTALATDAALVQRLGHIDAGPHVLPDEGDLLGSLAQLPDRFGAIFLVKTEVERAQAVSDAAAAQDLRPVLTEQDASAVGLCAATMRYLRWVDRDPGRSRVVVLAASRVPTLSLLLMVAGLHDVGALSDAEARTLPLERVVREVDVVIDLRPEQQGQQAYRAFDRPEGSVIRAEDVDGRAAVAPGLLRLLAACPAGAVPVEVSLLEVCARAFAMAAPAWRLPGLPTEGLADVVEAAARRAIDPRLGPSRHQ